MTDKTEPSKRENSRKPAIENLFASTTIIDSAMLFHDRNEIEILHDNQIYRLRLTKNGKLILNK